MNHARVLICDQAPIISIPEPPAIFSDTDDLLVSYESDSQDFVIIRFEFCIEHQLTSINDEGLEKHPYAKLGLNFYSFHEIINSPEIEKWEALKIKHFILTFKDNTLDVLARSFSIESRLSDQTSAANAIIRFLSTDDY